MDGLHSGNTNLLAHACTGCRTHGCREIVGAPGLCGRALKGRNLPAASGRKPHDLPCPLNCGQSGSLLLHSLPLAGVTAGASVRTNLHQPGSPGITRPTAQDVKREQETHVCSVCKGPACYCSLTQPFLMSARQGGRPPSPGERRQLPAGFRRQSGQGWTGVWPPGTRESPPGPRLLPCFQKPTGL